MPWFHWGKMDSHHICRISIICGAQCWDAVRKIRQNRSTLPSWRLPCYRYGIICHRSSLIRQSCHFKRYFDRVLLPVLDILNTQFKPADIHHRNVWTVDKKSCAKFNPFYWIFRMHVLTVLDGWAHSALNPLIYSYLYSS